MKTLSYDELKRVVRQWETAGPALERIRRERLRAWQYDWREVDALLAVADGIRTSSATSGLVEMQRRLRQIANP